MPTVLGPPPSWSPCPRDFRPQPRGDGRGPQAQRAEAGRGLSGAWPCVTGGADNLGVVIGGGASRAALGLRAKPSWAGGSGRGARQRRGDWLQRAGDVRLLRPQRLAGAVRLSRLEWSSNGELAPALQSSAAVAVLRRRALRRLQSRGLGSPRLPHAHHDED